MPQPRARRQVNRSKTTKTTKAYKITDDWPIVLNTTISDCTEFHGGTGVYVVATIPPGFFVETVRCEGTGSLHFTLRKRNVWEKTVKP